MEAGAPFGRNVPGLAVWKELAQRQKSSIDDGKVELLRKFLTTQLSDRLPADLLTFIEKAPDEELLTKLIGPM